ncbi:MAG: GGDEF domain-containing protein [Nitrospiraceae bacterium]|nr:GGDEF domain-containing protein [Nitrospiraceae bacterium]
MKTGLKKDKWKILELIDANNLEVHFQPVYSARGGAVYGYEALSRVKFGGIDDVGSLFRQARREHLISQLDVLCRENAIKRAAALGPTLGDTLLFINVCPDTIMDPAHREGITDEFAEEACIAKERIILEITEETAIHNYKSFQKAMVYYRDRGYKIAIDDFGAGHGGLKMLSIIEPDFVKIDRHFVQKIDRSTIKLNLVDAIAAVCHRMGIKVVAEGIETEEECRCILKMGIELLQGYFLHKPALLPSEAVVALPMVAPAGTVPVLNDTGQRFIGDVAKTAHHIDPSSDIVSALKLFLNKPDLRTVPVLWEGRLAGVLHRSRFVEHKVLGRFGYGIHLNSAKKVSELMEQPSLVVEAHVTLEEAAQRMRARETQHLYDDICVLRSGLFAGVVAISDLIEAITARSLILARGANPLTGLPGNEFIQREIEMRLSRNSHFDVCYIDINHFKPFNDHYGFAQGDTVLKALGGVIEQAISENEARGFSFAGHIGGDDFILVVRPQISLRTAEMIIAGFEARRQEFHGREECLRGSYAARNRRGEEETFPLISLSVGIVSTERYKIESYAHLASVATEVKQAAKMQAASSGRSAIVKDRRG